MSLKLAATMAAGLFAWTVPMLAQETAPPPPPRPANAIRQILDLTDQQLQQLVDLRQVHLQKIRDLNARMRDLGRQRKELLASPTPDPTQLGTLEVQQRDLRNQVQETIKAYREAALGLLTGAQKDKVAQIQAALRLAPQAGPLAAFGLIEGPGMPPGGRFGPRFGPMPGMGPMPPPMPPMHGDGPAETQQ